MSASREKKQRQDGGNAAKAAKVSKEELEYKRKAIKYTIIGVIVVVLVAALLIWNSGFFQRMMPTLKVGDETLSAAEFSYFYGTARQSTLSQMYTYVMLGYMESLPADTDMYSDTQTFRDYYMSSAVTSASQIMGVYKDALANGYTDPTVDETVANSIESMKSTAASSGLSYVAYLRQSYGKLMTASAYEKMAKIAVLASNYNSTKSDEAYTNITEDEMETYYTENKDSLDTYEYSYLQVNTETVETTDADGNELDEETVAQLQEEAAAAAQTKAEAIRDAYAEGKTIADLITEYEPSNSADHQTVTGTSAFSGFSEQMLALEPGGSDLVEGTDCWYFIVLHSRERDESATVDFHNLLVKAETTTEDSKTVAPTDAAWATAEQKINDAFNAYKGGEQTEAAFITAAEGVTEDTSGEGGFHERFPKTATAGTLYGQEVLDWLFDASRQPGDVSDPIRHEGDVDGTSQYWGYNVLYYKGTNEPVWKGTARNSLASEKISSWIEELAGNMPAEVVGSTDEIGR